MTTTEKTRNITDTVIITYLLILYAQATMYNATIVRNHGTKSPVGFKKLT